MNGILKPKEHKFVEEYVKNGHNASQAAYTAGYGDGGVSSRVAGHRLVTSSNIWESIRFESERIGLTPEKILKRLDSIIDHGKDSDAIQAIRTHADLTGSFAPKAVRYVDNEVPEFARDPEKIDEMLRRMRKAAARQE